MDNADNGYTSGRGISRIMIKPACRHGRRVLHWWNEPMHEVRCLASPRQGGSLFLVALLVIQKREKRKEFLVFFKRHLIRHASRATFCPSLGDADRVCFANRSIPHRRRLAKILAFVSAGTGFTPAPLFFQRACGQCVHESARLSRALCSHAWYS